MSSAGKVSFAGQPVNNTNRSSSRRLLSMATVLGWLDDGSVIRAADAMSYAILSVRAPVVGMIAGD